MLTLRTGRTWAGLLVLLALPWMVYAPLLDNGVIDDDAQYLWGAQVHHPADLPRLFTIDISKVWRTHHYDYDAYAGGSDYRPVGYLYFSALYPFFGMSAPAYRVVNFLVYGLGTLLVLLFVARLTRHTLLAWVTAGLFAVDPVRMEYAFLLAFQGGMSLVLYLAAALAYLAARRATDPTVGRWWYGLSLLAALAACFNHELAVSLPLALLLLEGFGGLFTREWVFRPGLLLPHGLAAGFYVLMRTWVESRFYPETGVLVLQLTRPMDLLYAGIHMVSRVITLFLPNFPTLRITAKVWVFGDVPGQTVLTTHPLLALGVAGLLLAAAAGLAWAATRPGVWRFLGRDPRGQWCLLAAGWSIVTMAPAVQYNGLASRHLLMAIIGSSLLKALGVIALGEWAGRRWGAARRVVVALLLVPLVLFGVSTITAQVRAWEEEDRANQTLIADAIRLVREASASGGVDDRPIIVYYLNGAIGNTSAVAIQEIVQAALGRDDIRVVVPYALHLRQALDEQFRFLPQVTINAAEIAVVNQPDHPYLLGLVYYNMSAVRTGLEVRNGTLYTLEILEVDPVNRNLRRLVIRYARPPGTRLLFLKFADGRLVREDVD